MERAEKFWNPYRAGIALGLVLLSTFLVMGKGLGASGAANRIGVFIAAKRDDGKPLTYAADEEHGLLGADTVFARHPGDGRVHFGQAVRSTAACGFVELDEQRQAGLMVYVIPLEHRHQYRRVEKTLHSLLPRFARSRSWRICCTIQTTAEADRG